MKNSAILELFAVIILLFCFLFLTACQPPQFSQADITVSINADGTITQVKMPAGSTVAQTITAAGVILGELDRLEPPGYTVLSDGDTVKVHRIREEFEIRQVVIPFEHQELRNESLPQGETRLIQTGQNGLEELTIRHLFEDGLETGEPKQIKEVILEEAVPEIVMLGVQTPFAPLSIPGKLAYLTSGNAWLMTGSTADREPLVTSGDLDGRIFTLSQDGKWLLFTRKSSKPMEEEINNLWVVSTSSQSHSPINLNISNVVNYAGWVPGKAYTISYSTVEPRAAPPGWQANNDFNTISIGAAKPAVLLEANAGGIYGWWGTSFTWSPDGTHLAYARPDGVGFVDLQSGTLIPWLDITPFNTHGDWAWVPSLAWGADGATLFVVTHSPPKGLESAEDSPYFDLRGVSLENRTNVHLAENVGTFATIAASPMQQNSPESGYSIAYMQAIIDQAETDHYRLIVLDRDGSNQRILFPTEGKIGLEIQIPVWAPQAASGGGGFLALIYQGNIWLVDAASGQAQQVTGDGSISRIDWKQP